MLGEVRGGGVESPVWVGFFLITGFMIAMAALATSLDAHEFHFKNQLCIWWDPGRAVKGNRSLNSEA